MDPDALRDEVDEWVNDGIITDAQAEAILARYETDDPGRSRIVAALSAVGAALVLVGVTWFLGTNWPEFSRPTRTAVLVAGPGLSAAAGVTAYDRNVPRVGHALCVLAVVLVGPSLFLFDELYALNVGRAWLLVVWTAVAIPAGHALGSRPGTGVGLLVLVALSVELAELANPFPVVGLLGVALFGVGHRRGPDERVREAYRVGGAAIGVGGLLIGTRLQNQFDSFGLEFGVPLAAAAVGAAAAGGWLVATEERPGAEWTGALLAALAGSSVLSVLAPETLPGFVGFLGVHGATLVALVATGYLGYRTRSRALVDLAALGALLQTLSFVASTVVDALSGSLALVVAGLVILGVGVGVERGRRSLLAAFGD
jgi:uncharacterized membrane protein